MNVKLLKFESANKAWESAYTGKIGLTLSTFFFDKLIFYLLCYYPFSLCCAKPIGHYTNFLLSVRPKISHYLTDFQCVCCGIFLMKSKFSDLSPAQVILRKVISVSDLTLCLDKRNASGKIEVYQEPMLYRWNPSNSWISSNNGTFCFFCRCSMTIHLLRHYHSATANMASTTRLDVYCNK